MIKLNFEVPIPPSVNACYVNRKLGSSGKGRIMTEAAKNWKLFAFYSARAEVIKEKWQFAKKGEKVVLEIYAHWPDARRHDMNNAHKLLADAFEKVVYEDDCYVLCRDMDFDIDRKKPRLEVIIYRKEDVDEQKH